jgi:hypothetical protein
MQTDYLISGAGASALSFLDVLLAETDANVVIVDRRDAPGGHWNDAYPFVRLHQSASFYGVNSRPLAPPRIPGQSFDAGSFELATKTEILHYFHDLMQKTYLASGRVTYLRNSEHLGGGLVRHLVTGKQTQVEVRKKIVNAGVWGDLGSIPATHKPKFDIDEGADFVPINDLPRRAPGHDHFTVIGAGKTGMDAVIWLLQQGVVPVQISWVRPNDYWLFKRERILNHPDLFTTTMKAFLGELESLANATTVDEFCTMMEDVGIWHRIDPDVKPTKFHAAVCSIAEQEKLAQIRNVIRMGHVTAIEPRRLLLEQGGVDMPDNTLYIDCTARAGIIMGQDQRPIFDGDTINISMIRPFQPIISAALIALLEARVPDAASRAACTHLVDFHDTPAQYIAQQLPSMMNQAAWSKVPAVKDWLGQSRLHAGNHLMAGFDPADPEKSALIGRMGPTAKQALQNIPALLAAR